MSTAKLSKQLYLKSIAYVSSLLYFHLFIRPIFQLKRNAIQYNMFDPICSRGLNVRFARQPIGAVHGHGLHVAYSTVCSPLIQLTHNHSCDRGVYCALQMTLHLILEELEFKSQKVCIPSLFRYLHCRSEVWLQL